MPRKSVYDMEFNKVYSTLVAKAERKGRTKAEVDECIRWLTGYVSVDILDGLTYGQFLSMAPAWNPRAELITGTVCGVRVENIEDPQEKKMRQLDKLVDELAQGKPMEKVLRCFFFQQSKVHRFSVVPGIEVQNYTKPMLFELQQ